ncbi:MAG: M20/M25/M40 family metallo-hydrolase [Armatimonadetes bacterium]|nr:M20/M25/M40 family metallo-hydrolase [Armatimonadota bacterium]
MVLEGIGKAHAPGLASRLRESRTFPEIRETVGETGDRWEHEGKKLGVLLGASFGTLALPIGLALLVPPLTGLAIGPIGLLTGMVASSLEERHIGIGKHLGGIAGRIAGTGAGLVQGVLGELLHRDPSGERVKLPFRNPTGADPREPLLPHFSHWVQKKIFGRIPERTQSVEIGENIGTFLVSVSGGLVVPFLASSLIGGPVGLVLSTSVGALLGIVAGGIEENALGVGRAGGELLGTAAGKLSEGLPRPVGHGDSSAGPAVKTSHSHLGKSAWNRFMAVNQIIAEPMVSFLIDTTRIANRLFSEKPYQSIPFRESPSPAVNRDRLVESFLGLAGIAGTSGNEQKIGDEICRRLENLKIPYVRNREGTIIATVPATVPDAPTVLLSAHQDTVAPTSAEAIKMDKRKIFTDETHILGADDRAGIAEILEGVQTVLEKGLEHPEIKLVFTVGEEVGLQGASHLKPEDISTRPTLGFVVDSTEITDVYLTNDSVIVNPQSLRYRFSQEDPLIQVVFRSMADVGTNPRPIHAPIMTGAGSDANTKAFNSGMIRSLAVGAGERDLHTPLENVTISDLERVAEHVVGFITHACDLRVQGDRIVPSPDPSKS